MERMTPRMAGHAITEELRSVEGFSCYGMDRNDDPTTLLVYAWKRIPVPATFGGWPVRLVNIASVRFHAEEDS